MIVGKRFHLRNLLVSTGSTNDSYKLHRSEGNTGCVSWVKCDAIDELCTEGPRAPLCKGIWLRILKWEISLD